MKTETLTAKEIEAANQRICSDLVAREVVQCVSYMISELCEIQEHLDAETQDSLLNLAYRQDFEQGAFNEGWIAASEAGAFSLARAKHAGLEGADFIKMEDGKAAEFQVCDDWQDLCNLEHIEPEEMDILEHWIVSDWLGRKLTEHGESVETVMGLTVWGRVTSGQSISMDGIISEIASDMEILHGQKFDWSKSR
jgi:hypothetical protein